MAKYALSFITKGSDDNTYYLAASVLGLLADKHGDSLIQILAGSTNPQCAQQLQKNIDDVIDNPANWDGIQCYPTTGFTNRDQFIHYATKTQSTIDYSTFSSGTTYAVAGLKSWLTGSLPANSSNNYTVIVERCLPYINYKIATMDEDNYQTLVESVIEAGGFTNYDRTNLPVQS